MPNAKIIATKKTVKKKKHPCVINILKESVKATTITKHILDLGVNLMLNKVV